MYPTEERIKELQERFGVHTGRFFGEYRFKNLNWYLGTGREPTDQDEWFCYGDVTERDGFRIGLALKPGETLFLGWKDLGPNEKMDDGFFRDGGGLWMAINSEGVVFDVRRDRKKS